MTHNRLVSYLQDLLFLYGQELACSIFIRQGYFRSLRRAALLAAFCSSADACTVSFASGLGMCTANLLSVLNRHAEQTGHKCKETVTLQAQVAEIICLELNWILSLEIKSSHSIVFEGKRNIYGFIWSATCKDKASTGKPFRSILSSSTFILHKTARFAQPSF